MNGFGARKPVQVTEPVNVEADPPPQPASDISATGYDAQNQQLTLEIG